MKNHYILYCKKSCPYCKKAVALLTEKKQPFKVVDLSRAPKVLEQVKMAFDWSTVPIIFKREDKFQVLVGGYTDLENFLGRRS